MREAVMMKTRSIARLAAITLILGYVAAAGVVQVKAASFSGTVLSVDQSAGKLVVKTEGSGTRFTFVVNEKTDFEGVKNLNEIKKGTSLTIEYRASGSQYIAQKVTAKK
jgi:hypothetical protein